MLLIQTNQNNSEDELIIFVTKIKNILQKNIQKIEIKENAKFHEHFKIENKMAKMSFRKSLDEQTNRDDF